MTKSAKKRCKRKRLAARRGTNMNTWYAIHQESTSEAEVRIYDTIGAWGITADRFVGDLRNIKADTIHIRLNTPGGEVFDATTIYNAIRDLSAAVVTHVDGLAASAGSVIAVAGDEVRMASNAYMMIHNAHGGVGGDSREMRKYAELLDKMNNNIADTYVTKAGKDREYWRGLMDAETWMTAEEAKELGLIDKVDEPVKREDTSARFDFKFYNKVPATVLEAFGKQAPEPAPVEAPVEAQPDVAPVTQTKVEITNMADTNPAPVAAQKTELAELTQQAVENYISRGRALGFGEGKAAELDRMKAIVEACPGNPELAIQAFVTGQDPAAVKLAFDADKRARMQLSEQIEKAQLENARLQAVIAAGGHPGVAMAPSATGPAIPQGLEPEVRAKLEWEGNQLIRAQNPDEKAWILFRTNEIKGNVKVLNRQP